MSISVEIPWKFDLSAAPEFIAGILTAGFLPKSEHIIVDFQKLHFIRPEGVTLLCNTIQWLLKRGVKVDFTLPSYGSAPGSDNPIKYLDDIGFFHIYLKRKLFSAGGGRASASDIKILSYQEYYAWLENEFIPWISRRTQRDSGGFAELKVCIHEIFNNIRDHSQEMIGCFFSQHYPREHRIHISISDFGVGIPFNIQQVRPELSDGDALCAAVTEGFSTKSSQRNRGAGLDILLQNIVSNFSGRMEILSLRGRLLAQKAEGDITISSESTDTYYPGTLIKIEVDDRLIYIAQEEEDFTW